MSFYNDDEIRDFLMLLAERIDEPTESIAELLDDMPVVVAMRVRVELGELRGIADGLKQTVEESYDN